MLQKAELSCEADSENYLGGSSETMYYIGLDVHKRTISYCVKDAAGKISDAASHFRGQAENDRSMPARSPTASLRLPAGVPYGSTEIGAVISRWCRKNHVSETSLLEKGVTHTKRRLTRWATSPS